MRKDSKEYEKINKLNGIMSGERSAIIKSKNGKFYRLKGCGDFKKGFTLNDTGFDFHKIIFGDANWKIMFSENRIIHIK